MKLVKMEFQSEQDRDAAMRIIIAIREKHPEPKLEDEYEVKIAPSLMVWESEREVFEGQMRRQGIQVHADPGLPLEEHCANV